MCGKGRPLTHALPPSYNRRLLSILTGFGGGLLLGLVMVPQIYAIS